MFMFDTFDFEFIVENSDFVENSLLQFISLSGPTELQLVLVDALEFELEKSSIVELRYRNEDVGTNTDAVGSKLKFELFIFSENKSCR